MKAKILTKIEIKQEWLDEVKENMPDIEFEIHETTEKLQTWYNTFQNSMVAVFPYLRQLVDAPTGYRYRVFVMSEKEARGEGITSHLAMYDHLDRDGVLDFYICLPTKLHRLAKLNGFRSNFAWIFCHEPCHGREQERSGNKILYEDRTHDWEAQGRLKELIQELFRFEELSLKVKLLITIRDLLIRYNFLTMQAPKLPVEPILPTPREELHKEALKWLGTDASPSDLAPDELGCAESVSTIISKVTTYPIITGTWTLMAHLNNSKKFDKIDIKDLKPGDILLYATGTIKAPFPGHVFVCTENDMLMSNHSLNPNKGLWMKNYNLASARKRWESVGYKPLCYRLISK